MDEPVPERATARESRDPATLRVMWLLNHGSARTFELAMLRGVGFREFFLPKSFPEHPDFRSASVDWSEDENLTIPAADLAVLNAADWYGDPGPAAWDVANAHFDVLFFIVDKSYALRSVRAFAGTLIWRAYGRERLSRYADVALHSDWGVETIRRLGHRFYFGIAYDHLARDEPAWLQSRSVFLPIGMRSAHVAEDWTGTDARILFVCPDIECNSYYTAIHQAFAREMKTLPYAIAGVQSVRSHARGVLGYTTHDIHQRNMRDFRVMFYHSDEPNHVHFHPFEAVRAGMPLVFMAGGLLDRRGGLALPGRATSYAEARAKLARILAGDQALIDAIRSTQVVLLDDMRPEACLPHWRKSFAQILHGSVASSGRRPREPESKPRIAVILPIAYRGGSLRSAKLVCEALRLGSAGLGQPAEIVLGHLGEDADYRDEDFADLHPDIRRRPFRWQRLDAQTAHRAMVFAEPRRRPVQGEHMLPDDGMRQFMDCHLWIVISDRLPVPLLPVRPYVTMAFDYLQRYVPVLSDEANRASVAAARHAERVLVTTRFTARDAMDFAGISAAKLRVVPMIAPVIAPSAPATGQAARRRAAYFAWPTNAGPHKNHANAMEALRIYYDLFQGTLDCHVTGVGSERLRCPRGLQGRVTLHGEMRDDEYYLLLQGARFLWHPTTIDNGTLSVIEAAQLGVPGLSSDYPAMREIDQRFHLNLRWQDARHPAGMARELAAMEAATQGAPRATAPPELLAEIGPAVVAREYWLAVCDLL